MLFSKQCNDFYKTCLCFWKDTSMFLKRHFRPLSGNVKRYNKFPYTVKCLFRFFFGFGVHPYAIFLQRNQLLLV